MVARHNDDNNNKLHKACYNAPATSKAIFKRGIYKKASSRESLMPTTPMLYPSKTEHQSTMLHHITSTIPWSRSQERRAFFFGDGVRGER